MEKVLKASRSFHRSGLAQKRRVQKMLLPALYVYQQRRVHTTKARRNTTFLAARAFGTQQVARLEVLAHFALTVLLAVLPQTRAVDAQLADYFTFLCLAIAEDDV